MKPLNVLLAVLGATAVGVTVGMLFAPGKGSETRSKLAKSVRRHCRCMDDPELTTLADKLACELSDEE